MQGSSRLSPISNMSLIITLHTRDQVFNKCSLSLLRFPSTQSFSGCLRWIFQIHLGPSYYCIPHSSRYLFCGLLFPTFLFSLWPSQRLILKPIPRVVSLYVDIIHYFVLKEVILLGDYKSHTKVQKIPLHSNQRIALCLQEIKSASIFTSYQMILRDSSLAWQTPLASQKFLWLGEPE